MWPKLRSALTADNAWVEQDRLEMRKLVATATIFLLAVLGGVGLLVYALVSA